MAKHLKKETEKILQDLPKNVNIQIDSDDGKKWEDEIAWRIIRIHELDKNNPDYDTLKFDIKMLLPYFETHDKQEEFLSSAEKYIHRIRRVALPSVLEILLNGFEMDINDSNKEYENDVALYSGLSYNKKNLNILNSRLVLLPYQHRMHPDISKFPREKIYDDEALKDAIGIVDTRSWAYAYKYPSRSVWIDIEPKEEEEEEYADNNSPYNLAEVNVIINELKDFMEWAKTNPNNHNKKGYWSVALLSFYNGQIDKIKENLNLNKEFNEFDLKEYNVDVKISTVDRFQGNEADIVLLSLVKYKGSPGFLDNTNRLNVAITRAKYQLVIIGKRKYFKSLNVPILKYLAEEIPDGTEILFDR